MVSRAILAFAVLLLAAGSAGKAASKPTGAFVKSVLAIDAVARTATFPLFRGRAKGKTVWYIATDASNAGVARARGLVFAPDLANLGSAAIAQAQRRGLTVVFPGAPDFSPVRTYVAGPQGYPPRRSHPGGVGDAAYSPFVHIAGTPGVIDAPIVATGEGPFDVTHHADTADRVVAIDVDKRTVTLVLARGFASTEPIFYVSTDASDPAVAAMERATYVPRLAQAAPAATIPIAVVFNGALDGANAQGLAFLALRTPLSADATLAAAASIGSPFNVLSLIPSLANPYEENAYTPLWSVEAVVWTPATIALNERSKIVDFAQLGTLVADRAIGGSGGKPFGPSGLLVNCPAIAFAGSIHY